MQPTLATLVQHTTLKLGVLAGEDRLDAEVRWAHASELADPVPWLDGGELLLVTGLQLPVHDEAEMRAYVARLAAAGVVGLGFGVGVNHPEVPPALLTAVREAGLPLLEVPRRTPFMAISKAVSAAIAAEQYRAVTAGFAAQRELTSAALSAGGHDALLERLAVQVGGWAALYDLSGSVTAAAPCWAGRRAAKLAAEVRRLADRPAPSSAVCATAPEDDRVELQSVGTGTLPRAVLAIGTDAALGTAERYAVQSAVAVLTLLTERSGAYRAAEARLGGAVLRMLVSGEPDHARAVAGQLYGGLLDAPLRVLVAAPGGDAKAMETLSTTVEAAAARAGESVLTAVDGDGLVLVAADGGAAVAACLAYAREEPRSRTEGGLALGMSATTGLSSADRAYQRAREAALVARRRGRTLVESDDVGAGSMVTLLADDAVRAFADGMLRALREHDEHGRGDLVASLRAWLARHGQWDAAAADLGVHRHTLRYRMRRVEEILDRSLDDPDVRMELWLSLKATTPDRPE
ncbi:PucR family transcriptional regulator ligand-binding domain-containing protein [Streptomyces sp. NBC_01803]|uniref:PucR family transcriptional regulator ligand-binding domain-containing protein n=1 Tax=Streptomyces sp. NBC_01803 TaxID=2975946 RepID=UPI002DD7F6A5|nr:PucR family transcriptional regulator ligand-binding domain-containing protein [Streptomyces sp. NBC_01803]WSA43946.1 PucR family transcriptional regulator ligand-binding domain-containing protein [Streptomyces sp. NBC_01803]